MTVRELRAMLTEVDNQEMTVKQLRDILFNVEEQDEKLTGLDLFELTREK